MSQWTPLLPALLALVLAPQVAFAGDLHVSGFALARATGTSGDFFDDDPLSAQLQVGIDWFASPRVSAHIHLIGRDDTATKRGNAGIAEAWVEGNLSPFGDRLRVRAGAMFLPGSRENVDALWESPYSITSSALNSWMGEEFRPIGIDATYTRGRLMAGATVYAGNDTFGALPPVRGWKLHDHWSLLGEWVPVDDEYYTSVSAENDDAHGWSARGGWFGRNTVFQFTRIDNRSDALEYGQLYNWRTSFNVAAAEYSNENWTIAGEYGWGPTVIVVGGNAFEDDLRAGYVLVSRRFASGRLTLRGDVFGVNEEEDGAVTMAWLFSPRARMRTGVELVSTGDDHRILAEVRYSFSLP